MFIGRQDELLLFDDLYKRDGDAYLVILYGQRRVGKTTLLQEWLQTREPSRKLFWFAEVGTPQDQLAQFSRLLFKLQTGYEAETGFRYTSWDQALAVVSQLASHEERLVLIIDEFSYLLAADHGIASRFQRAWDLDLKNKNLLMVLSGSYLGLMHDEILSPRAPLYGRAQAAIRLEPFFFGHTAQRFPDYAPHERIALYAAFGGVPGYWDRIDPQRTISQNIRELLLSANSPMHGEPRLLLHDHVSEPATYVSILRAVARGSRRVTEIASAVGMASSTLPKYLTKLEAIGLLERRISETAGPRSRSGRYFVAEPFMRFYFRFIEERLGQFRKGEQSQAMAELQKHMKDFIGTHTWEEVCREWVLRAGGRGIIPVSPNSVGSAWNKQAQIDVYGANSMEGTLVIGECKWMQKPAGKRVLVQLVEERAKKLVPATKEWQVFVTGFSRSGWTAAAKTYLDDCIATQYGGETWRLIGGSLHSLEQVDKDLSNWL